MKNQYKYILAGLAVTSGCYIWYSSILHHVFGIMLVLSNSFIMKPSSLSKEIIVEKMTIDKALRLIAIALFIFWIVLLLIEIPESSIENLLHQWYYTGSLWLSMIIFIILSYRKNKLEIN